MSRIGNKPIPIPSGVTVTLSDRTVTVQGGKGTLTYEHLPEVTVTIEDDSKTIAIQRQNDQKRTKAFHGLTRALLANMVDGVSKGFERKLELVGVGYRAKAQGKKLNLTLGFSHPVDYVVPEGVSIETPSQTEIVIKGVDKQVVGQVAAEIRHYRPPEPYKGKGVRYAGEHVVLKEAKKK